MLTDSYGRRITNLRVSLTDHCNFRCIYCMPPEGLSYLDKTRYLSIDQITRFVRVVAKMGVTHIRLTGGEPMLRKDLVEIVAAIKEIDAIEDLSITTNGSLLRKLAKPLRDAGLDRMNISLDSLDPNRFDEITRVSQYFRVRSGIAEALRVGFPLKINVVVLNGMTEEETLAFAEMAIEHDIDVRFLEFMPLCGSGWQQDLFYPIAKVRETVAQHYELTALPRGDRPAETFSIAEGRGRVGFIAPLSEPFCANCSRIRLTADGKIRPCLFSDYEVALGRPLLSGTSDEELAGLIRGAVRNKPWGSEFADKPFEGDREVKVGPMIHNIGG